MATKTQVYTNSCGAAALLCAAVELGHTEPPSGLPNSRLGQLSELRVDDNSEIALYQITSGATTGRNATKEVGSNTGYSYPQNVIFAARMLNLSAAIHVVPKLITPLVKAFHQDAVGQCNASGIQINELSNLPTLGTTQRRLRIVVPYGAGLHYVLERPDGTFMDPATGQDSSSLPYRIDTGFCITLG
jgi:hypothetical protein